MEKDNPSQDLVTIARGDDNVGEDLLPSAERTRVQTPWDLTPLGQEEVDG